MLMLVPVFAASLQTVEALNASGKVRLFDPGAGLLAPPKVSPDPDTLGVQPASEGPKVSLLAATVKAPLLCETPATVLPEPLTFIPSALQAGSAAKSAYFGGPIVYAGPLTGVPASPFPA